MTEDRPDEPRESAIRDRGIAALEAVYGGRQVLEWDALMDQLEAVGLRVIVS